ncbi:MAG: hypothetical protein WCY33_05155 [Clostridia bacterium]
MRRSFLTRNLKQSLVYWAPAGYDVYGRPIFAEPVQVVCRWEDMFQKIVDKKGEEVVSKAVVYTENILEVDGVVFKGELTETVSSIDDPLADPACSLIKSIASIPPLRKGITMNEAYL